MDDLGVPALRAAALDQRLATASPEQVIAAAVASVPEGALAIVSSFGTESAVLLHAAAEVDRGLPVLLLDTGFLFPETLAYRDALVARLGLTDVRSIRPDPLDRERNDPEDDLWHRDPDACCALRKVRPLARALGPFGAWINGRKRYQSSTRAEIPVVETDGTRLKFNPLATLEPEEIARRFAEAELPHHPLERFGFLSIGCMPCTSRVAPGEDARAGRWRGRPKHECGIHENTDGDGI